MFCSKCGNKIEADAEFCKKCGQKVGSAEKSKTDSPKENLKEEIKKEIQAEESQKQELKEEIKKELKVEKPKAKFTLSGCLIWVLAMIAVLGFVTIGSGTTEDKNISYALIVFPATILGIWFVIWLLVRIIKEFKKSWKKASLLLGLVLVVLLVPFFITMNLAKQRVADEFNLFQSSFADVIGAKYLADDIVAGKSSANFNSVKAITQSAVDNMAKEKSNDKYENAVYDWASKINIAAAKKTTWKNLPDLPTAISESLSSGTADIYFQSSLDHIARLKDYGDWAVAKNDTDAMRQIAAELKAEEVWQTNLSDQFAVNYVNHADAATKSIRSPKASLPRGGCKGVAPCRKKTAPLVSNLAQAARNYAAGTADAASEWKKSWDDFIKTVSITNGYNLDGTGVIQNNTTAQTTSPMEQDFNTACKAKNGTTATTGGVKDRLPVTLPAGTLNCNYQDNGHACWEAMTRTGQFFMGGENGCAEQGLLPKPIPTPTPTATATKTKSPVKTPTPKPRPVSYDGYYVVSMTKPNCDSPIELTAFSVAGNQVMNVHGSNAPIDSSGHANLSYGNMTVSLNFSGSSVSGTWSSSKGCSGTFSGRK